MDPSEHTPFCRIIEPYSGPEAMAACEPVCRRIAKGLVDRLPERGAVEFVRLIVEDFALGCDAPSRVGPIRSTSRWTRRNAEPTLRGHRETSAAVALALDGCFRDLLRERREADEAAPDDTTTRLVRERVDGRPLF